MATKNGLLGLFEDADALKQACRELRERQFRRYDAFTPFPVHGIEEAMGIRRSWIPWVTFGAGLTGGSLGLLLQAWTSAVDWPLNVGGKPFLSWPAFIPVTFELTILFGGLATAGALFFACGLPALKSRVLDPSLTDQRFGVFIPADEKGFQEQELTQLFKQWGAKEVRMVR